MSVIRSWICDNSRCGEWFDSYEPNPACPKCRCVRTSWRPAGGHIGGASKSADHELRVLADMFKMNDMNSAQEGRGAKKVNLPDAPQATGNNVMNFGGFAAAVDPRMGAQCVPTVNKVNYKVKAGAETRLAGGALGMPDIRTNTTVEARTGK